MAWLPEMLPGIVLVIGIMLFWNGIYKQIPLYNTIGIMVLAVLCVLITTAALLIFNSIVGTKGEKK